MLIHAHRSIRLHFKCRITTSFIYVWFPGHFSVFDLVMTLTHRPIHTWRHTYKTSTHFVFLLQKSHTTYREKKHSEPTNRLFILLNILKYADIGEYNTIQMMYRAKNQQLPQIIQKLFE